MGAGFWSRLPALLRAFLAGVAVAVFAVLPWGVLVRANLALVPTIPWASVVMAAFLFFYWKYLSGWGWPLSTAAARRANLRGGALTGEVWRWSVLAGGLSLAASVALRLVAGRMVRWPREAPPDLHLSTITIIGLLAMNAIVAGVSEEAGFRGYMQKILESRYSPALAITITSLVFGLAHLTHGVFLPAILFNIVWGALFGLLAYASGSILPGLIFHSGLDLLQFVVLWKSHSKVATALVWQAGADGVFWMSCALAIVLGAASVWAFRRLSGVARAGC